MKMMNMDKGVLSNIDMKRKRYKLLYWLMFAFLLLWGLCVCLFPVLWIILSGFKDVQEMYKLPATLMPDRIDLSKIVKVWSEMKFYRYYISTTFMSLGSVVFTVIICGLAGYVLSKLKPKGSKIVFAIFFWVMMMPGTMRIVPLYMTFIDVPYLHLNLTDTYLPMWLLSVTNIFNIILFKNFFDGISMQIVEAARMDGANNVKIFAGIMVPLSLPVFWTVAIFTFNGEFGNFFWPLLMINKQDMRVLGVQVYKLKTSTFTIDYQMLALIFTMLPQVIIFILFGRQIIGGVNVGGVKG